MSTLGDSSWINWSFSFSFQLPIFARYLLKIRKWFQEIFGEWGCLLLDLHTSSNASHWPFMTYFLTKHYLQRLVMNMEKTPSVPWLGIQEILHGVWTSLGSNSGKLRHLRGNHVLHDVYSCWWHVICVHLPSCCNQSPACNK
jgi:hypothetical protein